jgi:serine/threonine protein kinase
MESGRIIVSGEVPRVMPPAPPPRSGSEPRGFWPTSLATPPPARGQVFGDYRLISVIQRGGMGEILLAELVAGPSAGQRVVLKRLAAEHLEDEGSVVMFETEARLMSRLHHRNIVRVLDAPRIDDKQYLAMEFVQGKNLLQVEKRCRELGTALPPRLAVHLLREVLAGLQSAHEAQLDDGRPLDLVHRDVTPANILVGFGGEVKLTDFGIAKSSLSVLSTSVGVIKGTTRYLSPEQILGEPVSRRTDLFSASVVLVELLTGKALFDRGSVPPTLHAIVRGERPPIAELLPFRAPLLAAALERGLAIRSRDRFESAAALGAALEAAARELGPEPTAAELRDAMAQLFAEEVRAPAPQRTDDLDLSYLFEVTDPIAWTSPGERGGALLPGSKPLDASEFSSPPTSRARAPQLGRAARARGPSSAWPENASSDPMLPAAPPNTEAPAPARALLGSRWAERLLFASLGTLAGLLLAGLLST